MSVPGCAERLPSHAQIIHLLNNVLPPHPQDIPLQYHTPRWTGYDPSVVLVRDIVLSITPTPTVYEKLDQLARGRQKAVCFLHRPFQLDRRALPKGSLVLANHKRFDELLTTGYNTALASRLGVAVDHSCCIQGYKGDPERRIGILGPLQTGQTLTDMQRMIEAEVGTGDLRQDSGGTLQMVQAVAIMNAFGPDEVARVVSASQEAGLGREGDASRVLYLTGQPRDLGLQAARDFGMPVICVGHRPAEEWGIRFLAQLLEEAWPRLSVHAVIEPET
jgi:putative NIF3 family GTP cyclohydrolase 1 type 2